MERVSTADKNGIRSSNSVDNVEQDYPSKPIHVRLKTEIHLNFLKIIRHQSVEWTRLLKQVLS